MLSAVSYPSIQAALDANPGRMIYVPSGDYSITRKIVLNKDRSGLFGPGRIIQQTADEPVIEIENASSIEVRDLTLTRGWQDGNIQAREFAANRCRDLVIENVSVIDNRTRAAAIVLRECRGARISRCLVRITCVSPSRTARPMRTGAMPSTAPTDRGSWWATRKACSSKATASSKRTCVRHPS